MSTKRTKEEVAKEIAAMRALKPVGPFSAKTRRTIEVQIDALNGEVDETSEEFFEMDDERQMAAMDAINWLNGDASEKPSEGWGGLVA